MEVKTTQKKYPYGFLRALAKRTGLSAWWLAKILSGHEDATNGITNEEVKKQANVLLAEMTAAKQHKERQAVIAKAHSLGLIVMMNN
jgi:hypothetical protein